MRGSCDGAHSSTSVVQLEPVNPAVQVHAKASIAIDEALVIESKHAEPCWHGYEAHSSQSVAQVDPTQPAAQAQE